MLCRYDYVCLMRIDGYDDLIIDVHIGTLSQACTWDIANESLKWLICCNTMLMGCQRLGGMTERSARLRVGSDVSICTMEIGWHDRRGQHGCVLDRMYLYVPIWKSELLRMGGMIDEVSTVACWVGCVYMHNRDWVARQMRFAWLRVRSDVSICTNSGLWMVEKQPGNVWIVELWNECELCYELYWVMNCDYGWFIDSCVGDL